MTLNEAAYNVLNILRGGYSFNDENISIEQIKYVIEYYRSQFIRRSVTRGDRARDFEQDLGVVECVDASDEFQELGTDQIIFKTVEEIPEPVRLKQMEGITFVGSPDRRFVVPIVNYHAARYQYYNKFTNKKARSFILNDYVYVFVNYEAAPLFVTDDGETYLTDDEGNIIAGDELEVTDDIIEADLDITYGVSVRGIFERPREAVEFVTGVPFDDSLDPYPIPYDMLPAIAQSLIDGEFKIATTRPLDTELDHLPDHQTNA